jgi:16S rRNA (cytosine967-C5)-methyltransferase
MNLRAIAAKTIQGVIQNGDSLMYVLPSAGEHLSVRDKALLQEICYGTLRWYDYLTGIVDQLIRSPLKPRDHDIYAVCLVGAYQLSFTRIPDHAAIKESVDACRSLKKHWATKFVNGVLRQFQRRHDDLISNLKPSQKVAHSQWFYDLVKQQWPTDADDIFAANNEKPPMFIRVNKRHHDRDSYLNLLLKEGIEARPSAFVDEGILLDKPIDVDALPGFNNGWVSVQDEAAQLAAHVLCAQKGDRVLDACAAPGGKTCHILELEIGLANLTALEFDADRAEKIHENLFRLHLQADTVIGDASNPKLWWDGKPFDRILIDAPCTASGVIRRHPESKHKRTPDDIKAIAKKQSLILQNLWLCLKPGGTLVYATCSIFQQENEEIIKQFISKTPDALHVPLSLGCGEARQFGVQLFPKKHGHDGFFYAKITKKDP